jgi:hypothetical protein
MADVNHVRHTSIQIQRVKYARPILAISQPRSCWQQASARHVKSLLIQSQKAIKVISAPQILVAGSKSSWVTAVARPVRTTQGHLMTLRAVSLTTVLLQASCRLMVFATRVSNPSSKHLYPSPTASELSWSWRGPSQTLTSPIFSLRWVPLWVLT